MLRLSFLLAQCGLLVMWKEGSHVVLTLERAQTPVADAQALSRSRFGELVIARKLSLVVDHRP